MEQREPSHSKLILFFFTVTAIATSCRPSSSTAPAAFFAMQQHVFTTHQGITSMDGIIFSGFQVDLYAPGDTAWIAAFYQGKPNGIAKAWYPGGQVKEIRYFEAGRKTGVHEAWWPSGKKRFEYHFSKDVYDGKVLEWYETGELYKSFQYYHGQEKGMQQQFFANGQLQFNYEARNGRQYGLTGIKNCVNTHERAGIY